MTSNPVYVATALQDAAKRIKELELKNAKLLQYISALEDVCDSDQLKRAQKNENVNRNTN